MNKRHEYQRDLVQAIGPEDSLAGLSAWIPWGAKVLELGPARGYFTRHMATERNCTIDAVELDEKMAEQARPFCRKLIVGDLSSLQLADHFPDCRYQIIVLADVIEHLVDPKRLFDQIKPLLAPGGQVLLSVPNVAYAGLIMGLLQGQFEYRDEGLLDRTHLRFFTQDSLNSFLLDAGMFPLEWNPVFRPLNESEFKVRLELLPVALRDALLASPQALCYQWLVRVGLEPNETAPPPLKPCWQDAFPVRSYASSTVAVEPVATVSTAWASIGVVRQTVKLEIPSLERSEINIVLSDRPGYLRLYKVKILNSSGVLWSWSHGDNMDSLALHFHQLALSPADDHALITLLTGESWLQLNTSRITLNAACQLEIELGWPMSSDYMFAAHGLAITQGATKP